MTRDDEKNCKLIRLSVFKCKLLQLLHCTGVIFKEIFSFGLFCVPQRIKVKHYLVIVSARLSRSISQFCCLSRQTHFLKIQYERLSFKFVDEFQFSVTLIYNIINPRIHKDMNGLLPLFHKYFQVFLKFYKRDFH